MPHNSVAFNRIFPTPALPSLMREVTIRDLMKKYSKGYFRLPKYNRPPFIWTQAQKENLIRSICFGFPLPFFFTHHSMNPDCGKENTEFEEEPKYVDFIVDGRHRMDTILHFINGMFGIVCGDGKFRKWVDFSHSEQKVFLEIELTVCTLDQWPEDHVHAFFIRMKNGKPHNTLNN